MIGPRLGDQQAVEQVPMDQREPHPFEGVAGLDRQEAGVEALQMLSVERRGHRKVEFSDLYFQGDLPQGGDTDDPLVFGILEGQTGDGAQIFGLTNGPKEGVGVEQEGYWPKRRSISVSVSGASHPSGRTKAPRAEPSSGRP